MRDCYKILGVPRNATASEIRRAYRKKAKLLHPDLSHTDSDAFTELVAAYETLTDIKQRELFDEATQFRTWTKEHKTNVPVFDYRAWLIEQNDDRSISKLIFFDLMNSREDLAVAEYKEANMSRPGFRLERFFTREEFMDYGFILSEELILRKEYYDAVILLSQIIQMNYSYDYFKLFFPEVLDLARHVLKTNVEGNMNDELAIDSWERGLDLKLGTAYDILFLQKMAMAYQRMGDTNTAAICMEESNRLSKEKRI